MLEDAPAGVDVALEHAHLQVVQVVGDVDPGRGIFEHRTVTTYRRLFTLGLAVTLASGAGALLFGEPFLGQTFDYVHLPLFGEIELATALVFDVGIYCVVVGGLLAIFSVVGAE